MELDYVKKLIVSKLRSSPWFDLSNVKDFIVYINGYLYYSEYDGEISDYFVRVEDIPLDSFYIFTKEEYIQDIVYLPSTDLKRYGKIIYKTVTNDIVEIVMLLDGEIIYDEFVLEWYDDFIKPDYTKENLNLLDEI